MRPIKKKDKRKWFKVEIETHNTIVIFKSIQALDKETACFRAAKMMKEIVSLGYDMKIKCKQIPKFKEDDEEEL